jgi:hypothetical protein
MLLAAMILALVGAAAMAVHRSLVRGWAAEGACLLGDRAALAADSTLDWCLGLGAGALEQGPLLVPPAGAIPGNPTSHLGGQVRVRFLGEPGGLRLWKLTVEGRASAGGATFRQVREAYVTAPPPRPEGTRAPLTLRAWRIVRE